MLGQDSRNSELAHPKTHFALQSYGSRVEWEARRRQLRLQILSAAGLLPHPLVSRLSVQTVRQTRRDGYETEAILLETLPGYCVGATVYRPVDNTVRRPAVLVPHGHWKRGRVEDLPSYSVPVLGINLALRGYVAVAWDMAGYNDTRQTGHSFGGWREQLWGFNPMGLQLWNAMRVVDYLYTRRDVDAGRIGCTGASGGGTQTILLGAVDHRIACSAPVNMISAHYQGADPCEEAPNLRLGTNNVEIAAMMAPRPMLVVSCTGDWTKNTPQEEFPAIERTYALYGRTESVGNAHFEAEHNYDRNSREAVYEFFAHHLQGRARTRPKDVDPGPVDTAELLSPTDAVKRLDYDGLFAEWIAMSRRQNSALRDKRSLREQLLQALGCEWPARVDAGQWGEYVLLTRTGRGDAVPGLWVNGRGSPVVVIHPEGREAALQTEAVQRLQMQGRPLLLIDVFQTGNAEAPRDRGGRWYLSYNQTDDANRIQDVLTGLKHAYTKTGKRPALLGLGKAAVWCTFAAAVAPFAVELTADLNGFEGTDEQMRKDCFVPCIQRAGGLDAALRILTS